VFGRPGEPGAEAENYYEGTNAKKNRASNLLEGVELVKSPIFKGVLAQKCRGIYQNFPS
jgi:hypothetical protein